MKQWRLEQHFEKYSTELTRFNPHASWCLLLSSAPVAEDNNILNESQVVCLNT